MPTPKNIVIIVIAIKPYTHAMQLLFDVAAIHPVKAEHKINPAVITSVKKMEKFKSSIYKNLLSFAMIPNTNVAILIP